MTAKVTSNPRGPLICILYLLLLITVYILLGPTITTLSGDVTATIDRTSIVLSPPVESLGQHADTIKLDEGKVCLTH